MITGAGETCLSSYSIWKKEFTTDINVFILLNFQHSILLKCYVFHSLLLVAIALLLNPSSKQTEPHSLGALNVENRVKQLRLNHARKICNNACHSYLNFWIIWSSRPRYWYYQYFTRIFQYLQYWYIYW